MQKKTSLLAHAAGHFGGAVIQIFENGFGVRVSEFGQINLPLTLDCGQAFRWTPLSDGAWAGGSAGHGTRIVKDGEDLLFLGADKRAVETVWAQYFDFATDYGAILARFCEDETLREAVERYGCIRILRQDPWETLCSFIISSCNNIPRIKGIIHRLCTVFGEQGADGFFAFPRPERLAVLCEEDLEVLRAGYRAKSILDAARNFAGGELIISELEQLPDDELLAKLTTVSGVGQKVADCAMLFGFGRHAVFPVDRHIKRITEVLYPGGLPECVRGCEGIAQQYLFCLARGL
ncbi:MAG: DNA-3-methyladenine glycosylase 2 family protein [Oscillospiraceae bacterium]|nr:DNA-3-methyladenine glycosylase 2 family protein [Oscillospiraceae bacterium]